MTLQTNTVPGIERLGRPATRPGELYPAGATNANWFGLFNAISWYIVLGAPMILYATSEGASATVLGVITSLAPLMVIFQIPAARWIARVGYRRFTLAGWGSRAFMVLVLSSVPLMAFMSPAGRLGLVITILTLFTFLRGLTSGAWLPWLTELIPSEVRGRFLSRDQIFTQVGALISVLLPAALLAGHPTMPRFSMIFCLSAITAFISLGFLRRVPEISVPQAVVQSSQSVPWRHLLFFPPFFKLVVFYVAVSLTVNGLSAFVISFLRETAGYSGSLILLLSAATVLGAVLSVSAVGKLVDRIGSIRVLHWCLVAHIVMVAGWWALATGTVGRGLVLVFVLYFIWGAAGANFAVASIQLLMGSIPIMGRNHFFAIQAVASNLAAGLAPIGWGILLDSLAHFTGGNKEGWFSNYSIYFMLVIVALILSLVSLKMVNDPHDQLAARSTSA